MKMNKRLLEVAVLSSLLSLGVSASVNAAETDPAEKLDSYKLAAVVVEGSKYLDKFGNTLTEQSYYRTGGDVTVVDREEIESKHYKSVEEAIKRIPGVQIQGTGHHANIIGMTGSGSNYNNEVSINGDTHVIFLVNGKRIGSDAMDLGGPGNGSNAVFSMLNTIDAVEKIEVMKGSVASVYGADASGGAINIITRKGTLKPVTGIRMATGSWKQHNMALTHAGSTENGKTNYFVTVNRNMSGDTKYKDAAQDKSVRFTNTSFKEDGIFASVEHELSKKQAISFDYSHSDSIAHNPTAAPDYSTIDQLWSGDLYNNRPLGYSAPGYRNWFYLGAIHGNYIRYYNDQYNLQYTFNRDNGMDSFVRVYYDKGRAEVMDYAGNAGLMNKPPSTFLDPVYVENFKKNRQEIHNRMKNVGVTAQYAKKVGINNIIAGVDYKRNEYSWNNTNRNQYIDSSRNYFYGWVQDKIEISDKLEVTPSIRFNHFGKISSQYLANHLKYDSDSKLTWGINSNYKFDDTVAMYLSVANVYRPITYLSYDSEAADEKINPEKGMNYLIGVNKRLSKATRLDVNYGYLDMSNALGRYPVWVEAQGKTVTKLVNATQKKNAVNIALNHKFNDNWGVKASYARVHEKYRAKHFRIDPVLNGTTVDDMINAYRPSGIYNLDVNYTSGKFDCSLMGTLYAGMDERFFSDGRFLVMGLNMNYNMDKNKKLFLTVDNLTNEAYETKARGFFGKGAYPQAGRSFMLGLECKL